jgi:Rod binding domain-containing protein
MTDALALPAIADPAMNGGGLPMALSMKMGPGADIDKTAQDFEAVFATQLLQPMFESVKVDATFGGGHGEEVMRSFMLQEYGKMIASSGKLGVADKVKAEMLRAQEGSNAPRSGNARASSRVTPRSGKNPYFANTPSAGVGNVSIQ